MRPIRAAVARRTPTAVRRVVLAVAASAMPLWGWACDITHVATPDIEQLPQLENPQGALALRNGAVSEISEYLSEQALFSGLLVDEFAALPSASGSYQEDRRIVTPQNTDYPYSHLSAARVDAINAITALEHYDATPAWHIGELYALVAATEIVFSENLCSGVPLGIVSGGQTSYGPALSRTQLLAQALTDLDSASHYVSAGDSIGELVTTLRGRALVDSGQLSAAATAMSSVPVSYVYPLTYSGGALNQANQVYQYIAAYNQFTVADREGINGLPFISGVDPRLPISQVASSVSIPTPQNSAAAPITLASGIEAQLIAAEAALAAGQVTTWAAILNSLRASGITPGMTPLSADSTTNATAALRLQVMFRERAFWLFATGHRHGDLRRLVRQYGVAVDNVFPTGLYEGGPLTYGSAVVFQPSGETPNPNFHGCIDINP